MNLREHIFKIQSETDFNELALEVFNYQYKHISIYRQFVDQLKRSQPKHYLEIPFLPISFFKTHRICKDSIAEQVLFLSSGTTGQVRSQHFVEDTSIYIQSFTKAYELLIGNPKNQVVLALLPNYVEQGNSSLVFMVDHLVKETGSELSGFLLNQPEEIKKRYELAVQLNKEVVIFGVSYALLDLAEQKLDLSQARIIETGGMKGRRKELSKAELHEVLKTGLYVPFVSSEYGMTELLSQAYSNSSGVFECPPWMKILIRDANDPMSYQPDGKSGGINVIDLANINSCSFIATEDLGKCANNQFELLGRMQISDLRGCNLMVQ
jgi:hypothetical protein